MEEAWVAGGIGAAWLLGMALVAWLFPGDRMADPALYEVTKALGLEGGWDQPWPATGRVDGVRVEVRAEGRPGDRTAVFAVLDVIDLPADFARESLVPADDLPVGEPRFDEAVGVATGDPWRVRAILDGPTRDLVAAAIAGGARFEGGRWTLRISAVSDPAELVRRFRVTLRAHHGLRARARAVADPVAAVRAIARQDRHAGVRLQALDALLRESRADPETLADCAADVDVDVRLAAAAALGPAGHDTLARVVRTGSRSARVRAAGLLAASGGLAAEHRAAAEDALLHALDDGELAPPALLGLARAGSARAVPRLLALADAGDREVRGLAAAALAAVRSRLDPSAAGGLSFAPTEGDGGLSPAEAPGGGLSEAPRAPGRLPNPRAAERG